MMIDRNDEFAKAIVSIRFSEDGDSKETDSID
jgi:hypothetical protein